MTEIDARKVLEEGRLFFRQLYSSAGSPRWLVEYGEILDALARTLDRCEALLSALHMALDCGVRRNCEYCKAEMVLLWQNYPELAEEPAKHLQESKYANLTARCQALEEMLRRFEWRGSRYNPVCPICFGERGLDGHAPDCKLDALLKEKKC